jgi:8-oxo-dGTP diphosphatase
MGNELATAAMAREAKEEADIIVDPSQLKFVHLSHRLNRNEVNQERLDIFYELNVWQGEINNNEPDKAADLSWFELSDLPSNIIPFIKNVLSDVQSGISYSEYLSEPE